MKNTKIFNNFLLKNKLIMKIIALLLVLGFFNEYSLNYLFSEDKILSTSTIIKLRFLNSLIIIFFILELLNKIDFKKSFVLIILILTSVICIENSGSIILDYISTNLAIRESFNKQNIISIKGTHDGGDYYLEKVKQYNNIIMKLNINELKNEYDNFSKLNPNLSNFKTEYQIIKILDELSKLPRNEKKVSAIYIPRSFDEFWNLSCDIMMPPFLVPSISNIVMIEGLPLKNKQSCYQKLLAHGYSDYYLINKKPTVTDLTKKQICSKAKFYNLTFVYVLNINSLDLVERKKIICSQADL